MAYIDDIPPPTREAILALEVDPPREHPFVSGPPLGRRRVAMVSSAALHLASEPPFLHGSAEFRELPAAAPAAEIRMSHVSINFDRSGFQRDINVAYPIDRLAELAAEGVIGSVAERHFSVMGSTDPKTMGETVETLTGRLRHDEVDAVILLPV